jgi:ribonuclease-3
MCLQTLQSKIDYSFKDETLLRDALTHSSTGGATNYERLEFLGDRVLGLAVAELLYKKFPNEREGDLAKRLAALVQGSFLAQIAREIDINQAITLSDSERQAGGADNENIMADVFEAVIGALYLDSDFETCRALIERLWGERLHERKSPPQHPKTSLQEWAQGQALPLPAYEITGQSGPDHAPSFEITVTVEGYDAVSASGRSRQEAEKLAAKAFLSAYIKGQK